MNLYRHTVVVVGHGPFPLDMLRYDGLAPADSDAVAVIARQGDKAYGRAYPTTATFTRYADRTWAPTRGRWQSFRWSVERHDVVKL
jgi:hypothetical protein